MPIDPIKVTQNIRDSYIRYLTSTFRLRDENLRSKFQQEVEKFWFTNGPILEATPPFKGVCCLQDLIREGLLSDKLESFIFDAMPYLRNNPLYLHQEKAIRKILKGRNIVIASGTGSGKTESFLIPIYNYLLKEYEEKEELIPGVRVLLLYPMNALVNDQLRRLRELARVMEKKRPEIKITFGRYVGDTPETKKEGEEKFRLMNPGEELIESELLSREEMRESPPHILITNYAMLEYLLLRPKDSPFFDGEYAKKWKFLVLDEAHIYTGATGIEMAMLIRRLKDRVCNNTEGDLQCIATSATLVREEEDFEKVANFATRLFGEKFEWNPEDDERQDIIKGERIKIENMGAEFKPLLKLYPKLDKIIQNATASSILEQLYKACEEETILKDILEKSRSNCNNNAKRFLYEVLSKDERVIRLKSLLEEGTKNIQECVKYLVEKSNPSEEEYHQIISLINILVWTRLDNESLPLLPARYHLFVRAPEGIFVSFYPEPKIFLERREQIDEGYPVFEIASCRRCGQEYLVGDIKDGKLRHSSSEIDTPKKNRYFLLCQEDIELEEDEDQKVAMPKEIAEKGEKWKLCVKCGSIWKDKPTCDCCHERDTVRTLIEINPKDANLNKCYLCGLSSINIVREFIFQKDAPAAVLTTALYQNLQKEHVKERKILIFSDSRQDAAFFAPYLDFTYRRILFRRLIVKALDGNQSGDYRLNSLCEDVLKLAEENNVFDPAMDQREKKKEIWRWILQDFCGIWDRRNSLEGVGLVSFEPTFPADWKPIGELQEQPWNLTENEAKALYLMLLNSMRFNMAITFPEDGPDFQDEFFSPRNREYKFRGEISDVGRGIYSFIPSSGRLNTRLEYLGKLYKTITGRNDGSGECRRLLGEIWKDLTRNWTSKSGIYSFSKSKDGVLYKLDYRYWRVIHPNTSPWFICDRCGVIVPSSVRGVCPTFGCNGNLTQIDQQKLMELERNHYRYLYTHLMPITMVSHEHTAQLTTDYASNVQQRFIRGDINVLSCSTTFELGVDLGELEAIFLRNVPPEPSNYIQRAGRAGRRLDTVGFTLTFAQLSSHDITYFKEPEKMIEGRINPPVIELQNEKIISRHLYSAVIADFFRHFPDYFGTVDSFFMLESNNVFGTEKIKSYLQTKPESVLKSLKRIIPENLYDVFDIENWGWVENLIGKEGVLTIANEKVRDEFSQLKEFYNSKEEEWKNIKDQQKRNRLNADMDWANRRMETIKGKQLIDFLATHTVIPKYGFPVDVVELSILSHVEDAKNIQLERDLRIAISEFAPSSQVVANGYIWESGGLRVIRNRTWPIYWYAVCPKCDRFYIQKGTIDETTPTISCDIHGNILRENVHRFIVPIFGFVTSKDFDPKKPGESRPKHEFTTRPYFFGYKKPEEKRFLIGKFKIKCMYSSDGELAVICKGKKVTGFWVCFNCGAAFSERKKGHKTPYGTDCLSPLRGPLHLGHTFKTDVLSISFEDPNLISRDESFWLSLLYAILEGASQALGIRRQDLDGCLYPSENGIMLILFDNVPGGAGHVKRIIDGENLYEVLKNALARVKNCTCGLETSCYGCLRNYENQFCHELLKRGVVLDFLEKNLELEK